MDILLWSLGGILVNAIVGAGICAALDTKDQVFYQWYKQDPTGGLFSFLVIEFWPVMAFFMWRYRKDMMRNSST